MSDYKQNLENELKKICNVVLSKKHKIQQYRQEKEDLNQTLEKLTRRVEKTNRKLQQLEHDKCRYLNRVERLQNKQVNVRQDQQGIEQTIEHENNDITTLNQKVEQITTIKKQLTLIEHNMNELGIPTDCDLLKLPRLDDIDGDIPKKEVYYYPNLVLSLSTEEWYIIKYFWNPDERIYHNHEKCDYCNEQQPQCIRLDMIDLWPLRYSFIVDIAESLYGKGKFVIDNNFRNTYHIRFNGLRYQLQYHQWLFDYIKEAKANKKRPSLEEYESKHPDLIRKMGTKLPKLQYRMQNFKDMKEFVRKHLTKKTDKQIAWSQETIIARKKTMEQAEQAAQTKKRQANEILPENVHKKQKI